MNEEAQKIFDSIVKKNPQDLNKDEVIFIHARRPYLTDIQLNTFGEVIEAYDDKINPKPDPLSKKYGNNKSK
jgi:hypothetical protein